MACELTFEGLGDVHPVRGDEFVCVCDFQAKGTLSPRGNAP